jgi:hypothetical protein
MYVDCEKVYDLRYDCHNHVTINSFADFANYDNKVKKSITISRNTVMSSNNAISLRATDFIELQGGFYAPLETSLYLDNTPCDAPTGISIPGGGHSTDGL